MATQFQVFQDQAKGMRWRLLADNHQVVAVSSEAYRAKADCLNSIEIMRKGTASLGMYQDKAKEWRWRAIHPNGKTIATSGEGYSSKAAAEAGILRVQELSRSAPAIELDAPFAR
ncbi:MAG TPA: YegP family protein [Candidatus Thermoplasmatota archaeon]|nr:YegP family protein [Candidatus Thermoplasmatota archaeon]